jgi:hypothetical protein
VPVYARGRSRLRLRADPAAAGGGYDDLMGPVATRLRLPVQAPDAVLAVSVALFQLLGTYRATGNQPGPGRSATPTATDASRAAPRRHGALGEWSGAGWCASRD